jgi:two-component system response regulator HydG
MQGLLLRFLETGELQKVGADGSGRHVNVRVIAATNRNLRDMIVAGTFREDLFYRLNVIHIVVPPLRDRRDDIPALVDYFLARFTSTNESPITSVSPHAMKALTEYSWPGNVRELENVIERLVVTTTQAEISVETVRSALTDVAPQDPIEALAASSVTLDQLEDRYIAAVLRHTKRDKAQAARILGVDLSTLYRRAKQRRS